MCSLQNNLAESFPSGTGAWHSKDKHDRLDDGDLTNFLEYLCSIEELGFTSNKANKHFLCICLHSYVLCQSFQESRPHKKA